MGRIFSKALDLVQSLKFPLFESFFVLLVLYRIFISFQGFISVYQVLYFLLQYVAAASHMDKEHSNQEMLLLHHSLEITVTVGQCYGMECKRLMSVNRTVSSQLVHVLVLTKAGFMMSNGTVE